MKARRKALSSDEKKVAEISLNDKLAHKIKPGITAVYLASKDEIDLSITISRLISRGETVVAPRWNGETYDLSRLTSLEEAALRKGPMGILEPKDLERVSAKVVDTWLVPGLGFTLEGGRLGYGGGWYDRFLLDASPHALKIGLAYSFQILPSIPLAPHDVRLDEILVP